MGCDVHMFAEKFNPQNKKWEKVSNKFYDSYALEIIAQKIIHSFGLTFKEAKDIIYRYLSGKNNPKNNIKPIIQ